MDYRILGSYTADNCKVISIDCNGFNYQVIYGQYIDGGFFAIPNHGVGGDLASFDDIHWNAKSIGMALNNYDVGKEIAQIIAFKERRQYA